MGERLSNPPVTFVIFAYKQQQYIREAVEAALAQDYSPLEIILSDDNSPDRTYAVMEEAVAAYRGPHVVRLNRNPTNLGIGGHFDHLMKMVGTDFAVLAGGDDISVPWRVSTLVEKWSALGQRTALLYSGMRGIGPDSSPADLKGEHVYKGLHTLMSMAKGDVRVLGATAAMTTDLHNGFPPVSAAVIHEDRVLPFRALLAGGVVLHVDEDLVEYRLVGGVSRKLPKTMREYIDAYAPENSSRTLPDAVQRLADAIYALPHDRDLRYECEATIADQESRLAMHYCGPFRYEMTSLRWLFRGARPVALWKHYVKKRFLRAFSR